MFDMLTLAFMGICGSFKRLSSCFVTMVLGTREAAPPPEQRDHP